MSFSLANQAERDERNLWHVWVRGEVHAGTGWRDISRRDHLENLGLDERSIFKRMGRTRMRGTGFIGPRNVKSDGLLLAKCTFGFQKMLGIF
jgi:hypothetical protein